MLLSKTLNVLKAFRQNEHGGTMALWAMVVPAVVVTAGAAVDANMAFKARKIAQMAADNMALTASIAVDREITDRFTEGQTYTYAEIGGPTEDFTDSMTGSVEYDVPDGNSQLLARATVTGTYQTTFMSLIGRDSIDILAVSDAAYAEKQGYPASIFFVADNSGSMGNSAGNGQTKIETLEQNLTNFMGTLDQLDNDGTEDTFRTALYPFSADPNGHISYIDIDGVIPAHVSDPEWGTLSNAKIVQMDDHYGTDSSGALQDAADAFDLETAIHETQYNNLDPLKFLVFMTDGANNESEECTTQQVWVENETAEYWWKYRKNGQIRYKYKEPANPSKWTYVPSTSDGTGYYVDEEVCEIGYHFDVRSLQACDQMKAAGALIYTIAYQVDPAQAVHAEAFLSSCSSGDNFYKEASNSDALADAFDAIGETILTEVIRLKR